MAPGAVGGQVTIPVLIMYHRIATFLRQYAGAGLNISIALPTITGPDQRDGDFDNGIIAHEYHHGISNRLTGNGFSCLGNASKWAKVGVTGPAWLPQLSLAIWAPTAAGWVPMLCIRT